MSEYKLVMTTSGAVRDRLLHLRGRIGADDVSEVLRRGLQALEDELDVVPHVATRREFGGDPITIEVLADVRGDSRIHWDHGPGSAPEDRHVCSVDTHRGIVRKALESFTPMMEALERIMTNTEDSASHDCAHAVLSKLDLLEKDQG